MKRTFNVKLRSIDLIRRSECNPRTGRDRQSRDVALHGGHPGVELDNR